MNLAEMMREIYQAAAQIPEPFNWHASLREVANQEGCTCGQEGCLTSIFGGYGSGDGIARAEYLLGKIDEETS